MPTFFYKSIIWNPVGYTGPGGHPSKGAFTAAQGYGHEEWNGLPQVVDGERLFYAQVPPDHERLDALAGDIVLLMIASNKVQHLVGVAWGATHLSDPDERARLIDSLGMESRFEQAFADPKIRKGRSIGTFRREWAKHMDWAVNWKCSVENYLWLPQPQPLEIMRVTGKQRLSNHYDKLCKIDRDKALIILEGVGRPPYHRNGLAPGYDVESKGTRRIGQAAFRDSLDRRWNGRCAVTGCAVRQVLRASHIFMWSRSTHEEKTDPDNGLLLEANLDRLFETGLVSFDDDGALILSRRLTADNVRHFSLRGARIQGPVTAGMRRYLALHRQHTFLGPRRG